MIYRVLVAATALSFTATIATAVINPGARPQSELGLITQAKEPDKKFLPNKSPIIKKGAPIIVKKAPPKIGTIPKGPIVVIPKKTPPLVKGLPPPKFIPKGPKPPIIIVKPYKKKKHHGTIFAGVVLGSILAASSYYAYASPPADNLCWYWTSSSKTRGYWDYCDPPDEDEDD